MNVIIMDFWHNLHEKNEYFMDKNSNSGWV